MSVRIPLGDDPFAEQVTTLDGVPYRMTLSYNQRCACWYFGLQSLEGTSIAEGIKLVVQWDLLLKCAHPLRPPGKLFVFSNTPDLSPPGLEDLVDGGRCYLTYVSAAEIAGGA